MTTPDLLTCPLCGHPLWMKEFSRDGKYAARCDGCGYHGPIRDSKAEAIEASNRRAPVAPTSSPAPAPSGPSLDPQWLFNCAKFWYDTGIRDGANKWKIGLLLLAARAESLLKGSPVVKPHAHEPAMKTERKDP